MASDVERSLRFFAALGFHELFRDVTGAPRFACIARDGVEIHLQWHAPEQWHHGGDRPAFRFLVSEVDELYTELSRRDALPNPAERESPWSSPGDTPWGTREFHLRDPDGNSLQFYEAASNRPARPSGYLRDPLLRRNRATLGTSPPGEIPRRREGPAPK